MKKIAYLSLGSNQGNSMQILKEAIKEMNAFFEVEAISNVYQTTPVGKVDQKDFINISVRIKTDLNALNLLECLQKIENKFGRKRTIHWGPRTLDIDIIMIEDEVVNLPNLKIPHPEMNHRLFVIKPLLEVYLGEKRTKFRKKMFDLFENSNQKIRKIGHLELVDKNEVIKAIKTLILAFGDNPKREGLLETPDRVYKMYAEVLENSQNQDFEEYKIFNVEETEDNQIVLVDKIDFYSLCEHHMLPFFGNVSIAYIPKNGKILGLSKLPRLVNFISKRLSIQEEITNKIAQTIDEILNPKGVAVKVSARHMCMEMRGVKKTGSITKTTCYTGCFKDDFNKKLEFLKLVDD